MSISEITSVSQSKESNPKFTILIPTWNNLDFLKLCVKSIQKNSRFKHQIVVHINEGIDGTADWVRNEGLDFTRSVTNIGICYALNIARTLAKTDYIVYMNDDMYVCPDWDYELWKAVEKTESKFFFFSSTLMEPVKTSNPCVIAPIDYGRDMASFNEDKLLREFANHELSDWSGATWPPNIVHRDVWDLVGGYSVEFSPGKGSDPDFSKKLWEAGVRVFKGIAASRVYHFMSKSTGKATLNNGSKQFLRKWGMTSRVFAREVIKQGKPAEDFLSEPDTTRYKLGLLRSKIKNKFLV